MLKKEQVLETLKKYGFYSLNRAPYLYQTKEEIGVYFVWPNKHYGNLERVLCFDTIEELEEEVFKYWWYFSNKESMELEVEFDNYQVLSPHVIYKYKGTILNLELMKNFPDKKNFANPKEILKRKQLKRTANILILILKEKCKTQNDIYFKISEMGEELKKLNNTFNKKLKQYQNEKEEEKESYELLMDDQDDSEKFIHSLQDELASLETEKEIREFITNVFTYLLDIETSESHLQNVYLLNRYPYEIEDMKKKINVLESALKNKKKIFKNKQDPLVLLKEIDNNSSCKKMVNINVYVEKERKQIIEKYQNREDIDENVLGDYLANFEKLDIPIPEIIQNNALEEIDKKELFEKLKAMYTKLNKKEKSACFVATSFLKDCLNILIEKDALHELNVSEVISKLILSNQIDLFNESFTILDTYLNAKIRVKYFSILNINTFENFIVSLIECIKILESMNIHIDKVIYGYYADKDKEKGMINFHLKNIYNYKNKNSYIVTVMPKVPLFYSPINIVKQLDIIESTELIERENDTIFLLRNQISRETKKEKIVVTKFEKEKVQKKKEYIVVTEMKEKNNCNYYEDRIYPKGKGALL